MAASVAISLLLSTKSLRPTLLVSGGGANEEEEAAEAALGISAPADGGRRQQDTRYVDIFLQLVLIGEGGLAELASPLERRRRKKEWIWMDG